MSFLMSMITIYLNHSDFIPDSTIPTHKKRTIYPLYLHSPSAYPEAEVYKDNKGLESRSFFRLGSDERDTL